MRRPFATFLLALGVSAIAVAAEAADLYVSVGGSGKGTAAAPFGRIQHALNVAAPGDVVIVSDGTYKEALRTVRGGTTSEPILIRARGERGSVVVTTPGRVLTVRHPNIIVQNLVLDGQYGLLDLIRIESAAHGFTLRGSEVRRTSRDAIDMGAPEDVLIEDTLIHRALNPVKGRSDAHGIVAGAVRRLTIRNTKIHTFSGDAFQIDPGRSPEGWSDVLIEGCRFWLEPMAAFENGFPAGTVPGENAIDTKSSGEAPRATLTLRDTVAHGFRDGLIANMAAFNLKENIDAVFDGVTVFDSDIAFRMRGPGANGGARIRIQNAVIHSSGAAFRFEDDVEAPRIYNVTVGGGVNRPFVGLTSSQTVLDVRNTLFLGKRLPAQAKGGSNQAVASTAFVEAAVHDYQLSDESPAVDAGEPLPAVLHDRRGTPRPQGDAYDVGAFERRDPTALLAKKVCGSRDFWNGSTLVTGGFPKDFSGLHNCSGWRQDCSCAGQSTGLVSRPGCHTTAEGWGDL